MSDQSEKKDGFTVKKKVDESWKESVQKQRQEPEAPKPAEAAASAPGEAQELPETNFMLFITGLGMQAMMSMGESPEPGMEVRVDLAQAHYLIDIMRMLAEKTKNNLTPQEDQAFKQLLYELQVKFVQKSQG
ncbi:MAG: DUF1844 domain-containing protein [Candidatus Omnitrophota bacterium]